MDGSSGRVFMMAIRALGIVAAVAVAASDSPTGPSDIGVGVDAATGVGDEDGTSSADSTGTSCGCEGSCEGSGGIGLLSSS